MILPLSAWDAVESIPSGIPALDTLLGNGGYPRKYLTMISGEGGVGKTTIAIQSILKAQEMGIKTLYVETDYKFVPSYFVSLGIDRKKVTVLQGEVGEEVLAEMIEEIEKGKYGFVVVDTVSKITPLEEVQKGFDSQTIGKQAMLIGRFLRKLKPLANKHNMAVLLLNHERVDFMNNGKIKTPGGESIREDVVIWLRFSHYGENLKQGETVIGKKIRAKVWRKNQVADTEGHEVVLEVYNGKGFSATSNLLSDALDKGIIKKDGASFFLNGEKIAYGMPKMREWMLQPENVEKIKDLL